MNCRMDTRSSCWSRSAIRRGLARTSNTKAFVRYRAIASFPRTGDQALWTELMVSGCAFGVGFRVSTIAVASSNIRSSRWTRCENLVRASYRSLFSYLRAQRNRDSQVEVSRWVVHAFGRRLYEIFFPAIPKRSGRPVSEISAEWRTGIKGLCSRRLCESAAGPAARRKGHQDPGRSLSLSTACPGEVWEGSRADREKGRRAMGERWSHHARRGRVTSVTSGAVKRRILTKGVTSSRRCRWRN